MSYRISDYEHRLTEIVEKFKDRKKNANLGHVDIANKLKVRVKDLESALASVTAEKNVAVAQLKETTEKYQKNEELIHRCEATITSLDEELKSLRAEYKGTVEKLTSEYEQNTAKLKAECEETTRSLKSECEETTRSLKSECDKAISVQKSEFDEKLSSITVEREKQDKQPCEG